MPKFLLDKGRFITGIQTNTAMSFISEVVISIVSEPQNSLRVTLVWYRENIPAVIKSAEPELRNPEILICEGLLLSAAILTEEAMSGRNQRH